jgi:hypothetical protein
MVVLTTSRNTLLDTVALPDSFNSAEYVDDQRPLSPLLPTPVGFYAVAAVVAAVMRNERAIRAQTFRRSRRRPGR